MSDEEDDPLIKHIRDLSDSDTGSVYPPPLKTATKTEFVIVLRKNRRRYLAWPYMLLAGLYCCLFWILIATLLSYIF